MARKGGAPENLKPIQKGEVRNPLGINGFSSTWRGMLNKAISEEDIVRIANKLAEMAEDGHIDAIKFILEKTYPKDEKPLEINIQIDDVRSNLVKRVEAEQPGTVQTADPGTV